MKTYTKVGLILFPLGLITAIAGGIIIGTCMYGDCGSLGAVGLILLIVGALPLAVGVIMLLVAGFSTAFSSKTVGYEPAPGVPMGMTPVKAKMHVVQKVGIGLLIASIVTYIVGSYLPGDYQLYGMVAALPIFLAGLILIIKGRSMGKVPETPP